MNQDNVLIEEEVIHEENVQIEQEIEPRLDPAEWRQWEELKPTKLRVLLFVNSIFWYFNDEISDLLVIMEYYQDGKFM